ncbi:MAG: phosphoadenylyl-sulfate reductase [Acidimicrobiales bacterium]
MTIQAQLEVDELDELARQMESWTAEQVVAWALDTFGSRISIAASMADTVLVHMATKIDPDVEVVFLDTGFHFSETLVTLRRAQSRYRLNLRVERAAPNAPDLFEVGTEGCCAARKVALLDRALIDKDAWMTGVRRTEASTRSATSIISRDSRGLIKVCPLATWSDEDVERYVAENDVIVNPLQNEGYPSIGCWPCTEPVLDGEDARAGRWRGSGKTECGLHFS